LPQRTQRTQRVFDKTFEWLLRLCNMFA